MREAVVAPTNRLLQDGGDSNLWCEDIITCDDVCGLGKCVENGRGGNTWLHGTEGGCASPRDYGSQQPARCNKSIQLQLSPVDGTMYLPVSCCCER